ncbi:MAG TPA: gamma-glutamylcyclotransferase [Xanthobacteraceae bacterium]|jgi:cation transport protein ChaC|nr:gamma-glutamylcyclotransferase [Xanthobacteraceae bacterium]
MPPDFDLLPEDLWIFAYGSLMWQPGFEFVERLPGRVLGAHRDLCVLSHIYRGTPERPGLVLGLDRGGICRGIAYRVAPAQRKSTMTYLREREQVSMVYRECLRTVLTMGKNERRVTAVCYVVDRSHAQYAGNLTLTQQLHYVREAHGRAGSNRDYVVNTVAELETHGMRDAKLHLLAEKLKGVHEAAL